MLYQILHIPAVYREPAHGITNSGFQHALLIQVLKNSEKNCLLLTDEQDQVKQQIFKAVYAWPIKYRKDGLELLKRLELRNRFIKIVNPRRHPLPTCSQFFSCQPALCLCSCSGICMILAVKGCNECSVFSQAVDLDSYTVSSFEHDRSAGERIQLRDGEWDKYTFERRVWQPLFQHAKYVKLYDRLIGRTLCRTGSCFVIKRNFERGLRWIFEQFAVFHRSNSLSRLEIFTGLGLNPSAPRLAANDLKKWASERSREFGFSIKIHVKSERPQAELIHARYLATDQIALLVERGFDLLRTDGRVHDVDLRLVQDRSKFETNVRSLPDV